MKKLIYTLLITLAYNISIAQIVKPILLPKKENIENQEIANFTKNFKLQEAWFYENANYTGKKYVLTKGSYKLSELGMDANDFFSSALIPPYITVYVFEDDDFSGNIYMLLPDYELGSNVFKQVNNNFNKVEISDGKNTINQKLIGIKNINDRISSIMIFSDADYVSMGKDCDNTAGFISINFQSLLNNTNFGYANNKWGIRSMKAAGFDKALSSIKFKGNIESVTIYNNDDFSQLNEGQVLNINKSPICLANYYFTLKRNNKNFRFAWNDVVNSITFTLKPGKVTLVN